MSSLTVSVTVLIKSKQLKCQILDKNKFKPFFYSLQVEIIPLGMPTDICAFSTIPHVALKLSVDLLLFRTSSFC